MFYTRDERKVLWKRSQIAFAEKAHEFPCCDVPTLTACLACDLAAKDCKNKAEVENLTPPGDDFDDMETCPECNGTGISSCCYECAQAYEDEEYEN